MREGTLKQDGEAVMKQRKIIVHYYDGRVDEYPYDEGWLGPQPNFLRGFVEVDDGVFLNSKDIKRIEVRKPR